MRIEALIQECTSKVESTAYKDASHGLTNLRERLAVLSSALSRLSGVPKEGHLIEQHREQVSDHKKELYDTRQNIMSSCTSDEIEALKTIVIDIDKLLFNIGVTLKMKAPPLPEKASTDLSREDKMVKLPKLDIPTFDGDILNWLTFWKQFRVAIHDRTDLPQAQKLVYLCQSLKGDSARNVIEGLSHSGEQYDEAIR